MMLKLFLRSLFLIVTILTINIAHAYDIAHFYRASYLNQVNAEPRLERAWLSSFDAAWAGGQTRKGRNANGHTVPLLDIYGFYDMRLLGAAVANLDPNKPLDKILIDLAKLPANGNFGKLSFEGLFEILEGYFYFTQNFEYGFFGQLHIPIRTMRISMVDFTDLSPTNDTFPNAQTPEWVQFLRSVNTILRNNGLRYSSSHNNGVGDVSIMAGWTTNYEETERLDFVDFTLKTGVLVPTGIPKNPDVIFSIPNGYNDHVGIPLSADLSIGAYEWLTLGSHADILMFFSRKKNLRLKTDIDQSGLIKLAKGPVIEHSGALSTWSAYAKADHICRGLSLLLGYTYNHKNQDELTVLAPTQFDSIIVNSDEELRAWSQQVFTMSLEYDFAQRNSCFGPRFGLFYNLTLTGKRIFNTSLGGGNVGLEVLWSF